MRNIKLALEYDGTAYNGWQSQRKGPFTIQEVLEEAVYKVTGSEASIHSAGRTDAGVHALGQVASFRTPSALAAPVMKKALNAVLPPDIRVVDAAEAPEDFHPRKKARAKTYFYLIAAIPEVPVFFRNYMWKVPVKLDIGAMARAASHLRGQHDFSSFRAAGCVSKDPVKEMTGLEVEHLASMAFMSAAFAGEFVKITMTADAFMRHMARNIAGTLVEVGKKKISADDVPGILARGDRKAAGPTAPAHGLFLERVYY